MFKNKWGLLAGILVLLLNFLLNLIPITIDADASQPASFVFTHPIIIRGVVNSSGIQTMSPFGSSSTVYSPSQIKTAYNFPDVNASGQHIAIIEAYGDPNLTTDIATFDSRFGLTTPTINFYYPAGTPNSSDPGWVAETAMDVEWAQALAPGATIDLIITPNDNSTSVLTALQYAVNTLSPAPTVISMSFGTSESSLSTSIKNEWETLFATARAKGILLVASSGDEGAYNGTRSLSVNYPASSQYVIGVGGTTLTYNGSTYSETAWNDNSGSTGGGYSILFSQPSYQKTAGISNSMRGVPDVAMVADPDTGVYVYYTFNNSSAYYAAAGTSLGAPIWAAIIADCKAAGPSISLTNNYLYGTVYGVSGNSAMYKPEFNDVTSGNNGYYSAGTSWDAVTGIGTPNVMKLIYAICPAISLNQSSGTARASLTVNGTGYKTGETITITFDSTIVVLGYTTPGSSWSTSFTVPISASNSVHAIVATGSVSGSSSPVSFTISIPTTTTLAVSANSIIYSQPVAFTANVTASGIPTGTVTFKDGATSLGTATLDNSGLATFTTSAIPAGSHGITAVYNGDASFLSSTSPAIVLTVDQAATTADMTSSLNPATYGQAITFGARISASSPATGIPTGTVIFKDGVSSLGTATLDSSGLATFTTFTISAGSHLISSVYSGDNNFTGTSANLTSALLVNQAPLTVTATNLTKVYGEAIPSLTATAPGLASCDTLASLNLGYTLSTSANSTSPTGNYDINISGGANYTADYNPITYLPGILTVTQASTNVAFISSSISVAYGNSVTFTATISVISPGSGMPTGTVIFYDGSLALGAVTLNGSEIVAYSTSALTAGTHTIKAIYNGDINFLTSTGSLTQSVTQVSGGGGSSGGGGGSSATLSNSTPTPTPTPSPTPTPGVLSLVYVVNSQGTFLENISGSSVDTQATVVIESGTKSLTASGKALNLISTQMVMNPPSPPPDADIIGFAYDFGPDGAIFNKPVTISLKYDPSQIPAGIAESNLTLAWWDSNNKSWIILNSVLDTVNKTIAGQVSHFSMYTILVPKPADLVMSGLSITPAQVYSGMPVTISGLVTNNGGLPGSYTVKLKINGLMTDSQTVSLASGKTCTVTFISRQLAGTYAVEMNSLTGTFEVLSVTESAPVFTPLSTTKEPPPASSSTSIASFVYNQFFRKWLMAGIMVAAIFIVTTVVLVIYRGHGKKV